MFSWPISSPSAGVSLRAMASAAVTQRPQTPLLPRMVGCWFTGTVAAKYRVLKRVCAKSGLSQFTRGLRRSVRTESPRLESISVKDFSCAATASRARIQSAVEFASTVEEASGPASRTPVSSKSSRMAPTT
ncbi:hypothetical protein D3C73_1384910 [compost metagenome]